MISFGYSSTDMCVTIMWESLYVCLKVSLNWNVSIPDETIGYSQLQAINQLVPMVTTTSCCCFSHAFYSSSPLFSYTPPSLPGVKKPLGQYGPAGVADCTSVAAGNAKNEDEDEDDDIDLFGSDDEEVTGLFLLNVGAEEVES